MAIIRILLCFLFLSAGYHLIISSETHPGDAVAVQSLEKSLQNAPASWKISDDLCNGALEGVTCENSRVISLKLSSKGLTGEHNSGIGGLSELITLDLSFNPGISGPLPPQIGDLQKLETLLLQECSFTGTIPTELGNLGKLSFLSLNRNNLTGEIPPSLGNLSKLQVLDLADNQLTGSIPVSTSSFPGLDLLKSAKQFILSGNKLTGPIPPKLFDSDMILTKVMFDKNLLSGEIPSTIGVVQTLQSLFLSGNLLSGNIPSNINNLTNLMLLELPNNKLSGPLPNLSGMNSLLRLDLSNNSFQKSGAPEWLSTLPFLNILVIDNGPFYGLVPTNLFNLPQIVVVSLKNNAFSGTLQISSSFNPQLQIVYLQNNAISSVVIDPKFKQTLNLTGNPVCSNQQVDGNKTFCQASSKP